MQLIEVGFIIIPVIYHNENTGKIYSNDTENWYSKLPENKEEILQIIIEKYENI